MIAFGAAVLAAIAVRGPARTAARMVAVMLAIGLLAACDRLTPSHVDRMAPSTEHGKRDYFDHVIVAPTLR